MVVTVAWLRDMPLAMSPMAVAPWRLRICSSNSCGAVRPTVLLSCLERRSVARIRRRRATSTSSMMSTEVSKGWRPHGLWRAFLLEHKILFTISHSVIYGGYGRLSGVEGGGLLVLAP